MNNNKKKILNWMGNLIACLIVLVIGMDWGFNHYKLRRTNSEIASFFNKIYPGMTMAKADDLASQSDVRIDLWHARNEEMTPPTPIKKNIDKNYILYVPHKMGPDKRFIAMRDANMIGIITDGRDVYSGEAKFTTIFLMSSDRTIIQEK